MSWLYAFEKVSYSISGKESAGEERAGGKSSKPVTAVMGEDFHMISSLSAINRIVDY